MNAAVVESFDKPPRYTTFPDPVPTDDEILVSVTAAGLHPIVKALAKGTHYGSTGQLPLIPGVDGVGRKPDGARIFFGASRPPYGTFAERAVTQSALCFPIPDALDDATVAAMMNPAMSAWAALEHRAQFVAGENVLILGATGSAGHLAVQIAHRFGAKRIVAAGRNARNLEETKSLGADATISLAQDHDALVSAFHAELANKIDVVLDYVWGPPAEALLAAIVQKGRDHSVGRLRCIQIGNSAGSNISLNAAALRSSGLELLGSGLGSVSMNKLFASLRAALDEAAKNPFTVKPTTAPLGDVEKLWNSADEGRLVFQP
ncbi:MAG TPA: zinc-binding alcohol dehydrogenase family protein [Acidobacteriaceae bacterium]|jgi:NADPH2:quinone reductase|nr:zinc-binding alcohol dehydrogenase family protein [Acidobacteriaceae bacterium]